MEVPEAQVEVPAHGGHSWKKAEIQAKEASKIASLRMDAFER